MSDDKSHTTASTAGDGYQMAPGLTPDPDNTRLPPPSRPRTRAGRAWVRSVPFLAVAAYYLLLVAGIVGLSTISPTVREAYFTPAVVEPVSSGDAVRILQGEAAAPVGSEAEALSNALERSLTTLLVIVGALILVVPVAWVYMRIKRLQYDPALVRAVVILPIVVAGITLVVKYSIALAFALAGIVAAVRFRNTLKDPRDAVYIFLVIGIGLAAGVQQLDVALVMSMVFNFVMLILWRYNVGSIYGGGYGRTGVMSTGDPAMLVAQIPEMRNRLRHSLLGDAEEIETDGILLVHVEDPELARHTVQEALADLAKEWRLARVVDRGETLYTLEYVVDLKKDTAPADLVGALDERWSEQVLASEYFPVRTRATRRGREDEDDDTDR